MPSASTVTTGARHQGKHQVDIVNHQIEHDADVAGSSGVGAEALSADELRLQGAGLDLLKRGIEAFDVADLQQCLVLRGQADEGVGLAQVQGQRFLDQQVNVPLEEFRSDNAVLEGGNDDARGIDEIEQRLKIGKGQRAQPLGNGLGLDMVDVGDSDELDLRQRRQDAGVFLAQMSDADYSCAQLGIHKEPHVAK